MKNGFRLLISLFVIFVVFTILYFAIPIVYQNKVVYILECVFMYLAILVQIYPLYVSFVKPKELKSKFYGLPLVKIGLIYLGLVSLILVTLSIINWFVAVPLWVCIITNISVIGFAAFGFLMADTYKDYVLSSEKQEEINKIFIDDLKANARLLLNEFDYDPLKAKMKKLYDMVIYSDPISSVELVIIEDEITRKFNLLQEAYSYKEFNKLNYQIEELIVLLEERNLRCKNCK